jgi:hypothetical protein
LGEIPKKYKDSNYPSNNHDEWEKIGYKILFNGVFLIGGLFVILVAQLFRK